MVKEINPETGETREISMEEFMEVVGEGGGSFGVQQIVTDRDGNKHVTDIYGNMSGVNDGLDRSVNVFCNMSDLNSFVFRLINDVDEVEKDNNPDEKGFVMTVDLMDTAATIVITKTETKCTAELFSRDESKSNSPSNLIDSSEWDVVDGGVEMEISEESLRANMMQGFLLGCAGLRKYIKKEGTLAKLKEFGNKGTGIIVSVKDDDINIRIVRGKNRPDLPCNTFLLGEQMMRPYPDEMMTEVIMSGMSLEDKIAAAEGGDPDCMESLAQAYLNGDDVEQDFEKSAYWWEKLAETGNAIGQFNIGLHYAKGCGVKRDFDKAAEWMEKAAENGDEEAPDVAKMYKEMSGNLQKAQAGDVKAQAVVAKSYMQIGGSLEQYGPGSDYEESFKWSKKASDQGDLDGMYCLALCYEHGRGTAPNPTKAAMTYQKAAELGHAPSQWNLAVCYLNGSGYERNEVKGYMWAYQAADQGNELAINGLKYQEKTVGQVVEFYNDDENSVTLEGTQYEGRADRCERIRRGTQLTYKITKDKNGDEVIELFYNGGTVGLLSKWNSAALLALLKLDRIKMNVTVKSCIPKSQRGARARNADVQLNLNLVEKKPETPEEKAARLEAERKAAEEKARREKEEAERKAAEENARKEREDAERKKYEVDYAKWKNECSYIEEKRKTFVTDQLENERKRLERAAIEKRDIATASAESILAEQKKRKADAETTLASLGFFKFGEKKEQQQIIEDSTKRIADAESAKINAASAYQSEVSSIPSVLTTKERSLKAEAERNMSLPAEPEMPAFMKPVAPTMTENEVIKMAILDYLADGRAYTITDMRESIPEIMELSNNRVPAIVRQMVESGELVREEVKRRAYFSKA